MLLHLDLSTSQSRPLPLYSNLNLNLNLDLGLHNFLTTCTSLFLSFSPILPLSFPLYILTLSFYTRACLLTYLLTHLQSTYIHTYTHSSSHLHLYIHWYIDTWYIRRDTLIYTYIHSLVLILMHIRVHVYRSWCWYCWCWHCWSWHWLTCSCLYLLRKVLCGVLGYWKLRIYDEVSCTCMRTIHINIHMTALYDCTTGNDIIWHSLIPGTF